MNKPFTCIIAEDEALFRDALTAMLNDVWPTLNIVARHEDGAAALDDIAEQKPNIAFLDIRMPGLTGLEIAAAMSEVSPATRIVFVTAFDQYAIDAFEKGAVDYLLKPIAPERLKATIKRLQAQLHEPPPQSANADMQNIIAALAKQLNQTSPQTIDQDKLVWITASSGRETRLIMVEDILYFQSDNKYTSVTTAIGESLLRTPLSEIVPRLDQTLFRQIHRGTVVNMRAVQSLTRDESGRGTIKLKGRAETLTVSLTFMPLFKNM